MPGQNPLPCKFPVQLSQSDNDKIYMIAARKGIKPGAWVRFVLHLAIVNELQEIQQSEMTEG
jgi:hypothetical protein